MQNNPARLFDCLISLRAGQCDGVKARPRLGRKTAVAEVEMTGDAESDELMEWQEVCLDLSTRCG